MNGVWMPRKIRSLMSSFLNMNDCGESPYEMYQQAYSAHDCLDACGAFLRALR